MLKGTWKSSVKWLAKYMYVYINICMCVCVRVCIYMYVYVSLMDVTRQRESTWGFSLQIIGGSFRENGGWVTN